MKGPITEDEVVQAGNSMTLQKISCLNLSRHNLCSINAELFNQLRCLQSLDLSQNFLTDIPDDLRLPSLTTLDLSENQLKSVMFVKHFDRLEQIYLEDNSALTVQDYYIAKVLCPSLRGIDGGEDVIHIGKAISLYRTQLEPQIEAVFEARFSEVYSDGVAKDEIGNLHQEFVDTINQGNIVGSNLSMLKFRKFMIDHLCQELLEDVNRGKTRNRRRGTKCVQGSDTPSRYGTRVSKGTTLVKDYSTGTPISKGDLKEESSTPNQGKSNTRKRKRDETPKTTPVKSPAAKRKKDNCKTPDFTKLKKRENMELAQLPSHLEYEPSLFLRCHSKGNNPSDHTTKVWNCAFEPLLGWPGETSDILATCGGQNICFIDCQTGKVMKRYKDSSKSESFYSLAWTTLEADAEQSKDDVNILAVAGQDQVIKLIHPTQLLMFGTLKGHRGYVSSLKFHPNRPHILFSGSRDGRIIMWEIGTPDFKDYSIKWKQRAVLCLPKTDTICLEVSSELELLVVGCEESCYGWNLEKLYNSDKSVNVCPDFEFVHPRLDADDDEPIVVDGLTLLSNNCIVSKCVDQDRLYLWDLKSHTYVDKKRANPRKILVSPLVQLQYISTAVDYLYLNSSTDVLSVGDDKGNMYIYNLKSVVRKKRTSDDLLQPSSTLEFPCVTIDTNFEETMTDVVQNKSVVINCIAQSSGGEYIVCGTDNNLVCIWKASFG